MASRKEIKQEAVARVAAERAAKRLRRAELRAMSPADRQAARAADRSAARAERALQKKARADARASLTRTERREAKRRERVYRKVKHRPRRIIGWSAALAIVVVLAIMVAPIVSDISRLTSIKIDSNTAAGVDARAYGAQLAEQISDDGIVLLKNDDAVLPLSDDTVNVFSFSSFNLRYGGGGSGGSDQSSAVTLYAALEEQGITHNPQLKSTMEDAGAKTETGAGNGLVQIVSGLLSGDKEKEPSPDYLTEGVLSQAKEFSDTALLVVSNDGVEGSDFTAEDLRLTATQRELLDVVTANFEKVVVVVNSGNQMELGFLNEYPQIKGALWIGTPGPQGATSLAKILKGEVNPSGHLTDTYAYDVLSAPSTENFGDYRYENTERALTNYTEGIYIGYRYYETRYADDEAGYDAAVQYPFGYGLSYTDFTWTSTGPVVSDEKISVDVTVTNTGNTAGKDVVQLYYSAPHTPGGVEKSAIELAGYAKTATLAPGASETVNISFAVRDMASWDESGSGAYVLDAGSYKLAASSDVHTPVLEFTTAVNESTIFDTDADTGAALQNRFGYANGDLTYLSRDDWAGTYPDDSNIDLVASDALLTEMYPEFPPANGEAPTYGADNGIKLKDLVGVEFTDPKWEAFLDQLTKQEQIDIFARGAYVTQAVDRLGVPSAVLLDGPAGLNSLFSKVTAASFPTEVVIASTWDVDLAHEMGVAIGSEANAYGVQGWYAPGMNIHRTPMGGRNFEYYSEDPLVSGTMGAAMVAGAQSKDLLTFMKHFVLNEQETNARTPGVHVWLDEQALREIYLRPFEITVKEGGANGAMSSFIHVGPRWSGGNEQLLKEVLRGEWGFSGVVSTDAVLGAFMDPAQALRYGNDLMLAPLGSATVSAVTKELDRDPVGAGEGLRDRVHTVMYALLQTDLFR